MNEDREVDEPYEGIFSNKRSLEKIYNRLFTRIYSFVAYRVGTIQDTEDIVSDVFLRVVRAFPNFKYQGQSFLDAWVFKIAINTVTDSYRKKRHSEMELSIAEVSQISSPIGTPEDSISKKEMFRRLYRLLTTLAPREQEVIVLRFFAELKNREIAEVLDIDERSVSSYMCRGLRKLENVYLETQELDDVGSREKRR